MKSYHIRPGVVCIYDDPSEGDVLWQRETRMV